MKKSETEYHQFETRLKDSISLAFQKGIGAMSIYRIETKTQKSFYEQASCPICGYHQESLSLSHFSFNSHHGACEECHGIGVYTTFREEDVVNPDLTLAE